MYSKNDYRYYLEHRMAEENYLAHYGVKGMKWHKHKNGDRGLLYKLFGEDIDRKAQSVFGGESSRNRTKHVRDTGKKINNIVINSIKEQNKPVNKLKKKLKPKNQKVEVTDLKNEKTGEVYKSSKKKVKKSKNPLAPKNQKVEVITNKKKKRSKKEANWNKQMQQYGREILSERKR